MIKTSEFFDGKISFSELLELAADNDVEGFKRRIELNPNAVDEIGLWYGRQVSSQEMVLEHRTPLMVAAMYGSLDVMRVILAISDEDVNRSCTPDKCTALHCTAFGGSHDVVDAVKLLLANGADPNLVDFRGNCPYDVINVSRMLPQVRLALEDLLSNCTSCVSVDVGDESKVVSSVSSIFEAPSSPMSARCNDQNAPLEKKEYPVDPSLPDIKNSIYATDEFRMYSFKVRPCSRAYSHDWTECPFVHPGENARRRDPRKYHYSCVPCPEFRKGSCRRGDMCEYAHGVFECWLHPAQYRTRLCKDGTGCNRRVCFFAHTPDQLRPLYASTGSAVPSPRSMASAAAVMDMAAALNLFPGSPSTPPMSPSGKSMSHSVSPWQQPNIPTLHLPGSNMSIQANNIQTSRLRSSFNARDILNDMARSNLDELFSVEAISPRFSPSHKSAVLNHFQQQQQSLLSPINTKVFSPNSFGPPSPGGLMSPRGLEPQSVLNSRLSALAFHEKQQQMRSLSSRELGSNLPRDLVPENGPVGPWPEWESTNGRPDWSMNGDELNRLKRSHTTVGHNVEEPDLSWVQSLVKDSPSENKDGSNGAGSGPNLCGDGSNSNPQVEPADHSALGAWLDQIAA